MSEEDLTTTENAFDLDLAEADGGSPAGQFEDFEQNGLPPAAAHPARAQERGHEGVRGDPRGEEGGQGE